MVKTYIPDRGDLVWLTLDPSLGHEQKGRRPALILSQAPYNRHGLALMSPVTSQSKGYPFEVTIRKSGVSGVVLSDQIRTIDWQARSVEFITQVDEPCLRAVQENLSILIGS